MKKVSGFLPFDCDSAFAYSTPKVVRLRDRRLGVAKILITAVIFGYVVIYEAILNQGYLSKEVPQGAVMTTLRRPSGAPTLSSYCSSSGTPTMGADKLPCVWFDEIDALYPPGEELGSMFITTRLSYVTVPFEKDCQDLIYTEQNGVVSLRSGSNLSRECAVPQVYDEVKDNDYHFYVAEVEGFTVKWAHAVYGVVSDEVHLNDELEEAELEHSDGRTVDFLDTERSGSASGALLNQRGYAGFANGDILTVSHILDAAGVVQAKGGMDAISPQYHDPLCLIPTETHLRTSQCGKGCHWVGPRCSYHNTTSCTDPQCQIEGTSCVPTPPIRDKLCTRNSVRYDGGVLLVMIHYRTLSVANSNMGYTYTVRYIEQSEYKLITKVVQDGTLKYVNRHGVRILFVQTGFITRFSFVELLKTLVSGVTLIAVANIVVEVFLMRILPERHIYENYKYVTSEDFSVVRATAEEPFGKLVSEHFVYGINKPGFAPDVEIADKDSDDADGGISLEPIEGKPQEQEENKGLGGGGVFPTARVTPIESGV